MTAQTMENRRILVVDDSEEIRLDFDRILKVEDASLTRGEDESLLFGARSESLELTLDYDLDFAGDGEEAIATVLRAEEEQRPYCLAFVDVRMPPGLDGIDTTSHLWKIAPEMQIVLCTAYSDHSFVEKMRTLERCDQLLILKKPFDPIEVRQLVRTVSRNWSRGRELDRKLESLEQLVAARTEQLRSAYEMALEKKHKQTDFLAQISEEIRGPLSAIKDFAELLRRDGDITQAPPRRINSIDTILQTSRHVLTVADDILDMSQLEEGKLETVIEDCPLRSLVQQIEETVKETASGHDLKYRPAASGPPAWDSPPWDALPETMETDARRVRQIFAAAVASARKAEQDGGVELQFEPTGDQELRCDLWFRGADLGLREASQLESPPSQRLGLWTCQRLTDLLGGRLAMTFVDETVRLSLWLPLKQNNEAPKRSDTSILLGAAAGDADPLD